MGASIVEAWIQFKVDETDTGAATLTIRGEKTGNAVTFSGTSSNVSSRPPTSAFQTWNPPAWTVVGETGPDQRTPDLTAVIEEIIAEPGWASGNALVVLFTGTGVRTAESFDGDQNGAPVLHVEYTAP